MLCPVVMSNLFKLVCPAQLSLHTLSGTNQMVESSPPILKLLLTVFFVLHLKMIEIRMFLSRMSGHDTCLQSILSMSLQMETKGSSKGELCVYID
jgi:hypothetical protein